MSVPSSSSKQFTKEEVLTHNTEKSCFVTMNGKVVDVTQYMHRHPGGAKCLLKYGGQDMKDAFDAIHHSVRAKNIVKTLEVGTLQGSKPVLLSTDMPEKPIRPAGLRPLTEDE